MKQHVRLAALALAAVVTSLGLAAVATPPAAARPARTVSPGRSLTSGELSPVEPGTGAALPDGPVVPLQDVGGPEMSSPGVVVNYPAGGGPPLPNVPASAYVIADAGTGQVLAAKDPHGLFQPASTLKMLTAITLIPLLKPDQTVVASQQAATTAEYDVGLIAGQSYKVSDLFNALLLISANDAAVALTQATGSLAKGMALINAEAYHLQAYDVVAVQPNGLPANGQVTSAYDQALIARQALAEPAFMKYDSTVTAEFPVKPGSMVGLVNQNKLLTQYPGGIGGKIGWTEAAEATYIGMARRNGVTLIVTVMHCTSLQEITAGEQLLNWGFAMDGKVAPAGVLVPPLPAASAAPHKAGARAGTTARRVQAAPPGTDLPAVSLGAGGGLAVVALAVAGWLVWRRRRSAAAAPTPWYARHRRRPAAGTGSVAGPGSSASHSD
jgi:serine-type D-Ala-D-Ala carboxypeptidase (penicillin-binding protein 5/6)